MSDPQITKIGIVRQPWVGTPDRPRFLTPIYRVEYEKPEGQRQNALEFPALDAIEARKIASRTLGIPFSMH
jgi:hypothetical protein